jgi:hypothetical protein
MYMAIVDLDPEPDPYSEFTDPDQGGQLIKDPQHSSMLSHSDL